MKASVGDRIVIASTRLDGPVRDGRIVEISHPDGAPPYLVEWSGDGHRALVFPGPDAQLVRGESPQPTAGSAGIAEAGPTLRHVRSWQVRVDLFESGGETTAHAVLSTEAPTQLDARGTAHRRSSDPDVPEIGDEIAAARALRRLADLLLGTAAEDIAAVEGRPVTLPG
ncbi:MAG: dsRBD fold-containing protein [Actinomycetes bacterium]